MKTIPYRMYNKIRNLGDAINPYIIEGVSGLPSVYANKSQPHILGVGSIFFDASMHSYVWGSGMINAEKPIPPIDPSKIRALRGKKTVEALTALGYRVPDVPLGDPGFLLSKVYSGPSVSRKRYRACIVPHHASINHPVFKKYRKMDDVCVFNIMTDDLSVIDDMLESEVVVSQSLHGLIFAESLGIPSIWISDRFDAKWKFKFQDWYSTTELPQEKPLSLDTSLDELIKQSRLCGSVIDVDALMTSLPCEEVIMESDKKFVPHWQCKKIMPLRERLNTEGDELRKLSSLTNTERSELEGLIKKGFGRANAAMAHPVYTLLGDGLDDISSDTLEKIMTIMDHKHNFVFASIVKNASPPLLCRNYTLEGLKVTKNQHVGEAFLLRPNGRVNFSKDFLTFFV